LFLGDAIMATKTTFLFLGDAIMAIKKAKMR
jgi:hypothetical protein